MFGGHGAQPPHPTTVGGGSCVSVAVALAVCVALGVLVGVAVGVCVKVGVLVSVLVKVPVGVLVGVLLGVLVHVGVLLAVAVGVVVSVAVAVKVAVGVWLGVALGLAVAVGVRVGSANETSLLRTDSCEALKAVIATPIGAPGASGGIRTLPASWPGVAPGVGVIAIPAGVRVVKGPPIVGHGVGETRVYTSYPIAPFTTVQIRFSCVIEAPSDDVAGSAPCTRKPGAAPLTAHPTMAQQIANARSFFMPGIVRQYEFAV